MSRSEWFDGPAGPGDGTPRAEGGDGPRGPARPAARRRRGPLGTTLVVLAGLALARGPGGRHPHRRLVVRLRRLPRRVRQGADDQGPHLRDRGPRHGRCRRREPRCGIPHPADLRADDTGPAGPRAVPPGHRAAAPPRRHRHPGGPRPPRRLRLARRVAHGAPLGQPRAVRHPGPAVRDGRRLLRLHPAVPALPRLLRHGRPRARVRRRRLHPLRLRGPPAPRPRADDAGRLRAPRRPRRPHRPHPRGVLLARPLLPVDRARVAPHRHHLHRRQGGPADQGDPRRRGGHVRRLLPRGDLEPQLAPADHRCRPARRHGRPRRRRLPGAHPVAAGQAVGEVARGRVHRAQHRRDEHRLRARPGQADPEPGATGDPRQGVRARRRHRRSPACGSSTPTSSPRPSASSRASATTTRSPTPSTSTGTRSTGPPATPSSPSARSTSTACPTASATGSTTTRSTPTATASTPRTATSARARATPSSSRAVGAARSASTSRGSTSASSRRPTRSSVPPRAPSPASSTSPPVARATSRSTTPTAVTAASRSARCCAGSRTR